MRHADLHGKDSAGAITLERPSTIDSILVRRAARCPDAPFLHFEGACWTFQEVDTAVNRTAIALLELGVKPGERIALWMSNCPEWVIAQFAATRLGAILVPLNTRLRRDDLAYALSDCGARAVFTQANSAGFSYVELLQDILDANLCPELRHIVIAKEDGVDLTPPMMGWRALQEIGANSAMQPCPADQPSDLAYIAYTSGTTSAPKGAMLSHTNLNNAYNIAEVYFEGDTVFVTFPLFAVTGCHNTVLAAVIAGVSLVLQERFDPIEALTLIEKHKCTVFNGMIHSLKEVGAALDVNSKQIKTLRHANVFPRGLENQPLFAKFKFATAGTGYGMTETSGPVTHAIDPIDNFSPGAGMPWAGNVVRVVGADGNDVEPGEVGVILVRSSQVMLGYYNKPEATEKAISTDGWLNTGDMGFLTEEGVLSWIGRNDDVYKTSGFNVSGMEVEAFLAGHPKLADVAVVGVPDDKKGAAGAAFVIPKPGEEITMGDIEVFCRGRIASHKIPSHVISVSSFPCTTNGKVRKLQLRAEHFD